SAQRRATAAPRPPPAYQPGQVLVKFRPEWRPPAALLYQRGAPFAPYTGSSHIDDLHRRYRVRDIQPLLLLPQRAGVRRRFGTESIALDALEWTAHVQRVRRRYAARARRAPPQARMPDLSTVYTLTVPPETDIRQLVAEYAADPSVEYA